MHPLRMLKMFKMQAELDRKIIEEKGLEGQDLLPGLILALQVELGECANEWRGFKFWSKDQQPCTEKLIECSLCMGTGDENYEMVAEDAEGIGGHEYIKCEECHGEGTTGTKNPLLEEYVDCLHFILSIGNSIGYSSRICNVNLLSRIIKEVSVEKAFLGVFKSVAFLLTEIDDLGIAYHHYRKIFNGFNELGKALGFTPKEIEDAYMKKNAVNHLRQQEGY